MSRPLAVDLFCGLGGWTDGLLAEGYYVVGFDIERHVYGDMSYQGQLVIQDVTTLHGSQFKDAALIVASPPCQAYSYRAMPWKKAKALPPPDNTLFETCFRIQREACEAAGHHIPLIVENVRGAQKWVGRARWNYGSFYLWGDVPALMPVTLKATKNNGGSWFAIGSPGQRVTGQNPDGRKLPGCGANVPGIGWIGFAAKESGVSWRNREGMKVPGFRFDGSGRSFQSASVKHHSGDEGRKNGNDWFGSGEDCSLQRSHGSKSKGRKMASAMIAKIPLPLSRHIARAHLNFREAA